MSVLESERKWLDVRLQELRQIRSSYEPDWRSICDNILPWRQMWNATDANRGASVSRSRIINSVPTRALGRFGSLLMAGITSPARRWFHETTSDIRLADAHEVKEYLRDCEDVTWEVFAKSNLYVELSNGVYPDLGMIGNGGTFLEEDPRQAIRFENQAIGTFYIDQNANHIVDTVMRVIPMTVRQIVEKFGFEACSNAVQQAATSGNGGASFNIVHAVYPNRDRKIGAIGSDGMPFRSVWYEENSHDTNLKVSGYEEFPFLCPRWNVRPGDVWGRGPGWEVLGDCKALQHMEIQKAKLIDKTVDPPMKGANHQGRASLLPGELTYFTGGQGGMFEPAIVIPPLAHQAVREHIAEHVQRINEGFFVDLAMAMLNDQRAQRPTAAEVEATKQEVMLQLGPILQSLNHDLLEPLVTRTSNILNRQGLLPLPPQILVDAQAMDATGSHGPIQIEFISILHQAQKMTGITGMRELIGAVQTLAAAGKTGALDKLNEDAFVDEIANMLGTKPELVYSADEVDKKRAVIAQHQQAQAQGQAMLAATQGAKNLQGVEPQKIQELAQMITPAAAAQAGIPQ